MLAGYLGCAPAALHLRSGPWGKPYLPETPQLHFSWSDSAGAGVLAISATPLGIDLEKMRPRSRDDLAERLLEPADLALLRTMTPHERARAFAQAWTQREAFVKATGLGIGQGWAPMRDAFARGGPAPGRIPGSHSLEDGRWHLRTIALWPGFACTACTREPVRRLHVRVAQRPAPHA